MTLTLELAPELVTALHTMAERAGVDPVRYITETLQEHIQRHQNDPPRLPREEAALLEQINQGLPEAVWERYRALKLKRDDETLTPEEHAELIALTDEIEGWNVRRLAIVAELAKRRGVRLPEMMAQLGLTPVYRNSSASARPAERPSLNSASTVPTW